MTTLHQLLGRTRELVGVDDAGREVLDDELTDIINEAYLEVCGMEDWPFLGRELTVTTVVDQEYYDDADLGASGIPDRIDLVYLVDGNRQVRLRPIREAELVELPSVLTSGGTPVAYHLDYTYTDGGGAVRRLQLYPTPATVETITVRGRATPAALSDGADTPVFDEQFHPLLAYLAALYVLGPRAGNFTQPNGEPLAFNAYEARTGSLAGRAGQYMERMVRFYKMQHDDGLIRMGSRRSSRFRRSSWA